MADIVGQAKDMVGISGGVDTSGIVGIITIIALIVLFAILGGVIAFFIIRRIQYKYKIVIFEKVGGNFQPIGKDRARKIKISYSGDEVIELRKNKQILPFPSQQVSKNTYWYFISQDRDWFNFIPADFDENRREMGAHFLDKEMRYQNTALKQLAKERYNKVSFMEKYGGLIAYATLILVTAIGFWLLLDKMLEISGSVNSAVESAKQVQEATKQILGSLDNIQSGGSGFVKK